MTTINNRTGKTLCNGIIEVMAKLDVLLNMMTLDDEEQLYDWIANGGSDVSLVARSLLVASLSINPSHIKKDQQP